VVAVLAALVGALGSATAGVAWGASGRAVPTKDDTARAVAPRAGYAWPLGPQVPVVVRPFEKPTHRFGPGHRGVDLTGPPGAAVLAAAAGLIVFAGVLAGRGVVSVQHADGMRTTYEPVAPAVAAGVTVARGAVLGALAPGHPGCPAACLHWGARRDRTTYVDPLLLLAPRHVRLLPVPDPWPDGSVQDAAAAALLAVRRRRPGRSPGRRRSASGELLECAPQAPDEPDV